MKKPGILFFTIAMLLTCFSSDVNAQVFRYDVNKDGNVNITDVMSVVDYVLHKNNDTEFKGEAVDLGLPSGLKWASCNVGATKPEESGCFYAWGEMWEKEEYSVTSYKYAINGSSIDYLTHISGTEYDVAMMKWGNNWRMPTFENFEELFDNCSSQWVIRNGVPGREFTSDVNGKSIFWPAVGYFKDSDQLYLGIRGGYWMADSNSNGKSLCVVIQEQYMGYGYWDRQFGLAIRPVTE